MTSQIVSSDMSNIELSAGIEIPGKGGGWEEEEEEERKPLSNVTLSALELLCIMAGSDASLSFVCLIHRGGRKPSDNVRKPHRFSVNRSRTKPGLICLPARRLATTRPEKAT